MPRQQVAELGAHHGRGELVHPDAALQHVIERAGIAHQLNVHRLNVRIVAAARVDALVERLAKLGADLERETQAWKSRCRQGRQTPTYPYKY